MFTYSFSSNVQNSNGDIECTVVYTNGVIKITETIPAEANASTVKSTINNKLALLQQAENFVSALPANDAPSSTPLM